MEIEILVNDFKYFGYGFKSLNTVEELEKLKKDKKYKPNKLILDQAKEIIDYSTDFSKDIEYSTIENTLFLYHIYDTTSNNSREIFCIESKIEDTQKTIRDIQDRKKVGIRKLEDAIEFFKDLQERCLIMGTLYGIS